MSTHARGLRTRVRIRQNYLFTFLRGVQQWKMADEYLRAFVASINRFKYKSTNDQGGWEGPKLFYKPGRAARNGSHRVEHAEHTQ